MTDRARRSVAELDGPGSAASWKISQAIPNQAAPLSTVRPISPAGHPVSASLWLPKKLNTALTRHYVDRI